MNRILAVATILAGLALQATISQAAILLDNTSLPQPAESTNADTFQNLGFAFTPSANYTLDSLTLAMKGSSAGATTVSLSLWNVDGSDRPTGTALATASETITVGTSTNVVTLGLGSNATGSWDVTAGTTYALTFEADTLNTLVSFFRSGAGTNPSTLNAAYSRLLYTSSGTWLGNTTRAPWMQLSSATAVPEPSTWALALGGVTCSAWGMARRRRRAAGSVLKA